MYLPILHSKVQCTCKWSMMTERSRMNIKKNDTRNCTRKYKAKTVVHTAHCIGARTSFVRSVCSTRCAHNVIKMQVKGSHSEEKNTSNAGREEKCIRKTRILEKIHSKLILCEKLSLIFRFTLQSVLLPRVVCVVVHELHVLCMHRQQQIPVRHSTTCAMHGAKSFSHDRWRDSI